MRLNQRRSRHCPHLERWPERWRGEDCDIPPGQAIVEFFKPFLLHLLGEGLAAKTLRRHRDNLWMLGGELIRRRYDDASSRR